MSSSHEQPHANPKTMTELESVLAWLLSAGYVPWNDGAGAEHEATVYLCGNPWAVRRGWVLRAFVENCPVRTYEVNVVALQEELTRLAVIPLAMGVPPQGALDDPSQPSIEAAMGLPPTPPRTTPSLPPFAELPDELKRLIIENAHDYVARRGDLDRFWDVCCREWGTKVDPRPLVPAGAVK